jgi:hypothetical protein
MAMVIAGQPVGRAWLVQVTGYNSTNTVQQALEYLREIGIVQQNKRFNGWCLASGAKQLPLVLPELEPGDVDNSAAPGDNSNRESQNLTLDGFTTATYMHSRDARLKAEAEERESKNDSRSFQENLAALHETGVRGQMAEKLARLEHVTPGYVRAHAEKVERDHDSVGLLITRIRDGDPEPKHPRGCACAACRANYARWSTQ